MTEFAYDEMDSPVGKLTIVTSDKGLHEISWDISSKKFSYEKNSEQKYIRETKKQLNEYFQGKRKTFNIPLVMKGTDFQMSVWQELQKIHYGETISYGEQAKRIGDKNKARAVGVANGRNHLPIIIPCHRVIGSNGTLVGFAGGLDKKSYLLELEKRYS